MWAGDTQPSMPKPPEREVLMSFDGFGFTTGGIAHDISEQSLEHLITPFYAPDALDVAALMRGVHDGR